MVTGPSATHLVGLQGTHLEERRGLDTSLRDGGGELGSSAREPGNWVEDDTTSVFLKPGPLGILRTP